MVAYAKPQHRKKEERERLREERYQELQRAGKSSLLKESLVEGVFEPMIIDHVTTDFRALRIYYY